LSIIQCYAPTKDINGRDKEALYEQLQAPLLNFHRSDILPLIDNLMLRWAQTPDVNFETVMGKRVWSAE